MKNLLTICIPIWDNVPGIWFVNFLLLLKECLENKKFRTDICCIVHQHTCPARTDLVQRALTKKAKWILFLDDDSIIQPHFVEKLIQHDKDIVSAITFEKLPPFKPVIFKEEDGKLTHITNFTKGKGLIPIDAFGFGCILIKTDVFRAIKEDWFRIEGEIRADMYFSALVKKYGMQAYADTDLVYGHYGGIVTYENFLMYQKE